MSWAWLHSICHPSGDVWLSASGNPENYCAAVGGDESAWLSGAAATIPAAALIGLSGRRTRWSMAIAAIALLASAANFTAFWVVFTRG